VILSDIPNDRQAQPCSHAQYRVGRARRFERLEYTVTILDRDAMAGISNYKFEGTIDCASGDLKPPAW
jgi:hypothetical protein